MAAAPRARAARCSLRGRKCAQATAANRNDGPCDGSHPLLDAAGTAVPALGSVFPLELSALPPQPGVAVVAFGTDFVQWNGAWLPLRLQPIGLAGGWLALAPLAGATLVLVHPGTAVVSPLAIPNALSLAGLVLGAQAFVFDAGGSNQLGALSNALLLRIE